jgi:threonine dehydrogenase-like Zn-dependent dehydrogenase
MTSAMGYAVTITAREQAELLPQECEPAPLGPREVAGRTLVSLISAGTELASAYQGTTFPRVPGYAAVCEVEAAGDEVTDLRAGDLIFCMGGHRSRQRVSRESALRLPEGLSPEAAVFARMMSVSMSTLVTTAARPPQKVLVMGLGLVGHLAAKVFSACGYNVFACDPSGARREIALRSGIARVLPSVSPEDSDLAGQVALVLECSGHEEAAQAGCRVVRKGGEVVLIGSPWQRRSDLSAHELLREVFFRYVTVRSGWEWELPVHPADFRAGSIFENLAAALQWLAEGRVSVEGLPTCVSPHDAQRAYQDLLHQRAERLAILFDWRLIG